MNQLTTVKRVEKTLALQKKQFQSMLPSHIDTSKFLRAAVTAVQNTPDLQEAEYESIISACQKAASDGLIIDNREAALVVFNSKQGNVWVKKAQYMPMINGILKKARQSGQLSTLSAHVVRENDEFEYWVNEDGVHFSHKPEFKKDRGELMLAYAVAKLKDGSTQLEIMTKDQIEEVRRVSKSGADKKSGAPIGIWKKWPEEMWRKTVLRRLCKYLPSSSDLDQLFDHDNDNYDFNQGATPAEEPATSEQKETKAAQVIKSLTKDDDIIDAEFTKEHPPAHTEDDVI